MALLIPLARIMRARDLALPSDLTDTEWAVLEPFFPPPPHVGRPRTFGVYRSRLGRRLDGRECLNS